MPRGPDPLSEDTIAAIATPSGRGAVALVRVSGRDARRLLRKICPPFAVSLPPARHARLSIISHPDSGELLDRAVVTFFAEPASYTGEDCVEISTHGGLLTPQLVLAAVLAAGARLALPGEFTRRALENGKLDLTQAEAILDLVNGTSPALHRAAIHQLERGLSRRIEVLRGGVLRAEALVAYGIDFPDEDEPPVPPSRIVDAVQDVLAKIDRMLATAPQGEMLREGGLVVLAGYPNVGKSSLFNALLGFERSIVTEIPGTTRDAVEASITIRGFPFRLVDTAGLRDTEDRVEGLGVEVAHRYLAAADVVLYCVPAGKALEEGDREFLRTASPGDVLVVRTKADLKGAADGDDDEGERAIPVSAMTGAGLDILATRLVAASFGDARLDDDEAPLITHERHARALKLAASELRLFLDALESRIPMELAATHLAEAAAGLEEIIGVVAADDILGVVFGQFCVGK